MKYLLSITLCIYLSIFYIGNTLAQNCISSNENYTYIYYGNGVGNTKKQAQESLIEIYLAYNFDLEKNYSDENFVYNVSYNTTRGTVRDVMEVILQKMDEDTGGLTLDEIFTLMQLSRDVVAMTVEQLSTASGGGRIAVKAATKAVEIASDMYIEMLKDDAYGLATEVMKTDETTHYKTYLSRLKEGGRVIVIAHSQGNLFANKAVEKALLSNIYTDDYVNFFNSIGIVGIANPAGKKLYDNNHITAHDDRVIDALRLTQNVLDSNIQNDPGITGDHRDWLNHGFLESYFDSSLDSREQIDEMFYNLVSNLEHPERNVGNGLLTVSLDWVTDGDLDLHILEPSLTHVYYSEKEGTSGYIDQDSQEGPGVEHYYVPCGKLEEGEYFIGVNYFRGNEPMTGTIQISAGNSWEQYVVRTFTTPSGSEGNNHFPIMASVIVSIDDNGKYHYEYKPGTPQSLIP